MIRSKESEEYHWELLDETKPDWYVKAFSLFLKLIRVNVNWIHIWFEDDFFSGESPYSFGLVINEFKVYDYDKDITFDTPVSVKYSEILPLEFENLYIKKCKANDVKVYWNTKSETYIPCSLIEGTKDNSK